MQQVLGDIEKIIKKSGLEMGMLEKPPKPEMGDYAYPCFELAKRKKKSPVEIAKELSSTLKPSGSIKKIQAQGPYINFYANWEKLGLVIINEVSALQDKYGQRKKKKEKVMIEFAHPNTHKAFHIGHSRNIALGESLCRVLEFGGIQVIRTNYQGDIGPHVARCLWGMKNLGLKPPKEGKGIWLGEVYTKASKEAQKPEVEREIREINKALYAGDSKTVKLWKETKKWSLDYFNGIYEDFGANFDRLYFESEVEGPAIKLSKELLKKKIAKLSDGAIVFDLEEYNLGIYVLLTSEGTPLYSVKDFILASLQEKEYKPDKIIHVVGSEQDLYFKQLIKSLELFKPKISKKEEHLSYGLVNLESGKMKSREGQVILYEELKGKMLEVAKRITKEKNPELSKAYLGKTSEIIAMGALKYDMIKVSPNKTIIFNWDRALSFEGNNAPYLQYTHARCASIIRKSKTRVPRKIVKGQLSHEKEIATLKKISEFPGIVIKAATEMHPHIIANYIFELCDSFNEFYQSVPVLRSESDTKLARLSLVMAVRITLKNALNLLGIVAPESM